MFNGPCELTNTSTSINLSSGNVAKVKNNSKSNSTSLNNSNGINVNNNMIPFKIYDFYNNLKK